jgi:hypothetical protein
MSERTLKQLVGALVVLVGIWVVTTLFSGGAGSIAPSAAMSRVFDGVEPAAVSRVLIQRAGGTFTLEQAGDRWTVNGYPADREGVTRLLEELSNARVRDLAATNPANHARMGVTDGGAVTVTFDVGGAQRTILVGNAGQRFATAYVRLPDADDVYLLDGDLRGQLTRDLDGWRNRTMVAVDSAAVARIDVSRPGERYSVVRGDSVWTFDDGGELRVPAVAAILAELSGLVATGFLMDGDSIAAMAQESTTRALDASGNVLAEITIGSGSGDRWARTTTDDFIYRVSSFRAGRVAPPREDVAPDR